MPTHTLVTIYTDGGDFTQRKSVATTTTAETNATISLTASQADKLTTLTLDVSQIKSLYMCATVDCVIETNSTSSPADTITLVANEPLIWTENMPGLTCPLDTDVTAIYATNSDAVAGTVEIRVAFNPA